MPLVPRHIQDLESYKPGKNHSEVIDNIKSNRTIKLASNENSYGPSPKALESIQRTLSNNFRYPDSNALKLRTKLAQKFNVNLDNVIVGAGSEGIMSTIMRTFLRIGDEIIAAKNSFIGFRVLANASGIMTNWIPLREFHHDLTSMARYINDYTKLIYLANPDNPTGTYFKVKEFDEFMKKVPSRVLVILDEAYFEYAKHLDDYPDSMYYRYDNVITLRTFSKAHGLAGLRVGYGFGHQNLINNLLKIKLPFEPSWPAQVAASAALDDVDYIESVINKTHLQMNNMKVFFKSMGIEIISSAANFITLVFNNKNDAVNFNERLLQKGVIMRYLDGWGLDNCIRITIGKRSENEYLIDCIKDVYSYK